MSFRENCVVGGLFGAFFAIAVNIISFILCTISYITDKANGKVISGSKCMHFLWLFVKENRWTSITFSLFLLTNISFAFIRIFYNMDDGDYDVRCNAGYITYYMTYNLGQSMLSASFLRKLQITLKNKMWYVRLNNDNKCINWIYINRIALCFGIISFVACFLRIFYGKNGGEWKLIVIKEFNIGFCGNIQNNSYQISDFLLFELCAMVIFDFYILAVYLIVLSNNIRWCHLGTSKYGMILWLFIIILPIICTCSVLGIGKFHAYEVSALLTWPTIIDSVCLCSLFNINSIPCWNNQISSNKPNNPQSTSVKSNKTYLQTSIDDTITEISLNNVQSKPTIKDIISRHNTESLAIVSLKHSMPCIKRKAREKIIKGGQQYYNISLNKDADDKKTETSEYEESSNLSGNDYNDHVEHSHIHLCSN